MKTYIIGHKKPDLDSTVAPISLSSFFLELAKKTGNGDTYTPSLAEPINTETEFVFNKFGLPIPQIITSQDISSEDKIILVDHNESDQRLDGLNPDQIIGIYDHHKANITFSSPINIHIRTYGSVSTVIWELFQKENLEINPQTASLMLSAILSDTVGLKSPTTTQKDIEAVADLSAISGITDISSFTLEIFKAKSNIGALTDEQIVLNDYKIFDFSGKKVLIGQIETVEQTELLTNRATSLLSACNTVKAREGVDFLFLAVTDILQVNTKLLLPGVGESDLAIKAFGGTPTNSILDLGAKLSRKKEIAPPIENALKI